MANSDNARGLSLARMGGSAAYTGAANRYYVPSSDGTAIYIGGLVKPAGSADANGVMSVTGNVSTGDAVLGVVVGIEMETHDSTIYRVASSERYVYVVDDPNAVFEVQDDSVGGALAATAVGNSADLTGFTSGTTATGRSTIEIDSSTITAAGDGTEDVVIIGLVQREDNVIGANGKWLVRLNNHFFVDAQAGA
jgi:multidrug efflux pump subunit AcrA (membrane-fusion protein)